MGERDRPAVATPYRNVAAPGTGGRTDPRYVPVTRRRERLGRGLRSAPVLAVALLALALEKPWLLGLSIAWAVAVVISARLHTRALNGRLKALAGALARDVEPHVATRGLEAFVADAAPVPALHSVGLLFLGIARARGGDIDGALALLHVVDEGGWLAGRPIWQAWLMPWLAQLHAARGELDAAEAWLATARARLPEGRREVLRSAEILVALRRGRYPEALERLEHPGASEGDEDAVRGHFEVLRAFARSRIGDPLPDDEVRRIVRRWINAPGRALPLEKWWAELGAFVTTHAADAA